MDKATRKLLAAGGLVLGLGCLGLFASAAADVLDATPMPPALIDADGFLYYAKSSWLAPPPWGSWPADPTWPAPPAWGSQEGSRSRRDP